MISNYAEPFEFSDEEAINQVRSFFYDKIDDYSHWLRYEIGPLSDKVCHLKNF